MRNQIFNKRIPTIFGIGLLILAIILTTFILRAQTGSKSKALDSEMPQNVKITNLSDNSFTITYRTQAPTTGSVNYGREKELGATELDDLDKEKGNFSPKNIHSITVKKLTPDTKYHLVIISGEKTFLNDGIPFEITTGPNVSSPSVLITNIKGKVVLPDGNPPTQALVYLSANNSQLMSTTTKGGEFNFSLKSLRTNDLSSYFKLEENTVFKLLAINDSLSSTVLLSGKEIDSIPTITLSNDYDFTQEFLAIASKSGELESSSFPTVTIPPTNLKPQILTPKKGQGFTDQKPQFTGISLPNETVEIVIHSDENIQTQVKADNNGNWTYRPPNTLSPGQHTITIKTRDSSGILTTIMQSFTVFAQGSQVSESATPSATPTSTPILTPIPTPTTILILTPTPIPSISPATIESKGGLPPTGSSSVFLIIGGVVTAITGIALFLLTHRTL